MRRLYSLLLYVALPLVGLRAFLRRSPVRPGTAGWRERRGHLRCGRGQGIWVHAASVGEVQVAAVLLQGLRARDEKRELTLTCGTVTGHARACALLTDVQVQVCFAPYDLPGAMRRALSRLRPRLLVLIETELWPNLLHEARRAGVPVLIGSARVSQRSARRYRKLPGLLLSSLRTNVWVAAQAPPDAERFRALGVPAARVSVIGNLKFDRMLPPLVAQRGAALRAQYAQGRPLWTAGSTHPGEEESVLEAHRQILLRLPGALLVLAPRHPQRFEETAAKLTAAGWRYRRRSQTLAAAGAGATVAAPEADAAGEQRCEVLLLDTLGELVEFYAAADVAFVGGSLVAVGGHNLLEPAALGLPVLSGPQQFNSPDIARILLEAGALSIVPDASTLAATAGTLLADPAARARQGERARAAVEAHRGARARLEALAEQLAQEDTPGLAVSAGEPASAQ